MCIYQLNYEEGQIESSDKDQNVSKQACKKLFSLMYFKTMITDMFLSRNRVAVLSFFISILTVFARARYENIFCNNKILKSEFIGMLV